LKPWRLCAVWGAYFNYPINSAQSIVVTETDDPLQSIHGRVKYRNFNINGFDEETTSVHAQEGGNQY
jgi:hypothetical protein